MFASKFKQFPIIKIIGYKNINIVDSRFEMNSAEIDNFMIVTILISNSSSWVMTWWEYNRILVLIKNQYICTVIIDWRIYIALNM